MAEATGSAKTAEADTSSKTSATSKATDSRDTTAARGADPFAPVSTDEVRRLGSQPPGVEPFTGAVTMVSRDANGNPAESDNFVVLIPEGVSDAERDAHWNRAGEAQGAKHLSGGPREVPPPVSGWLTGFTDEEWAKREDTERRELYRHNFREDAP